MINDCDAEGLLTESVTPFDMWSAENQPDQMTKRLYSWRMENQTLRAYADKCEDKTAGRIAVEMPAAHHPLEFSVDRERIFDYVKKRRRIVPRSFSDRFFSLPFLPTFFDRAFARQRKNAVDYYGDVRELTQLSLVMRAAAVNARTGAAQDGHLAERHAGAQQLAS